MTDDEMKRAVELAQVIDAFDPTEAGIACRAQNEPPVCLSCNGEYRITNYGDEPTALDDGCAHEVVALLAKALLAANAENERMRPVWEAAVAWRDSERRGVVVHQDGRVEDRRDPGNPLARLSSAIDAARGGDK